MKKKILNVLLDDDLHADFKSLCAKNGLNMTEVIVKFVQEFKKTYQNQ
jgi:antitoxin component of RelBE/YafQ-DinJ toxin-antitoxin module